MCVTPNVCDCFKSLILAWQVVCFVSWIFAAAPVCVFTRLVILPCTCSPSRDHSSVSMMCHLHIKFHHAFPRISVESGCDSDRLGVPSSKHQCVCMCVFFTVSSDCQSVVLHHPHNFHLCDILANNLFLFHLLIDIAFFDFSPFLCFQIPKTRFEPSVLTKWINNNKNEQKHFMFN